MLEIAEEKSPLLAAILSAMLPGVGHIYLGKTEKGIGILFFFLIFAAVFFPFAMLIWLYAIFDAYREASQGDESHRELLKLANDLEPPKPLRA